MASLWRAVMGNTPPNPDDYDNIEYWSNPERTGWLTKQGEYIKTWHRRWFVLKQGKLFWFKESIITRGSKPRGVVPVATCLTVKGAEDVINKEFAFELSTRSDTNCRSRFSGGSITKTLSLFITNTVTGAESP
ncbi:putative pleckstrin domain, PH-like domain superfamily [Helianthus annuus]|nr:putative pleckstrin domain, PH-like domain superfamily [Helianthus annuus]KAJ0532391.1 putative pleckstrin domain, PH-like domain superfamily [Helianthus annuus]KAJ0639117.1 putative pleckstrin domain, PH-like domain superfamily [Helianthus annuus]KAJ0710115.1 putative pleckstrin domain, PH-like domain superfamily [Helianthus annuus]KAJ0710121.1 putative pleckstrin domain, PH-like domain superfamily [Helianthus annuus]